jgi:hypothetical protein
MTDEEIFDLAERHGWMDDFGRWNFKDDGLIDFTLAVMKAEREACAKVCLEEAKEAYHQEAFYLPQGNPGLLRIAEGAKRCADAIRARGDHGLR